MVSSSNKSHFTIIKTILWSEALSKIPPALSDYNIIVFHTGYFQNENLQFVLYF